MITELQHSVAYLQANVCDCRWSQIFSPGIIFHLSPRGTFVLEKLVFSPKQLTRVIWHRPPSEMVRVNVVVLQESVEEELLGDVTDGEKCGQDEPLGPKYPHVLKSLQQGWSAGGGLEMHVWLGFCASWYFKACFALTQWVFFFAWAELQLELMLHCWGQRLVTWQNRKWVLFLIISCLLYLSTDYWPDY